MNADNPLEALRYIRLMAALKDAAIRFALVLLFGSVLMLGLTVAGHSVPALPAVGAMVLAGVLVANIHLYRHHREVFGL